MPTIVQGLVVTSRHFFRNLRGFVTGHDRTDFVVQYPEERVDYSDAFRGYLMERCTNGVDLGMDVVNLDEIMTSVGLMSLEARGTGFCSRCLERFRSHLREIGDAAGL